MNHDQLLLESPFDPEDEPSPSKAARRGAFKCPLKLPRGWRFIVDSNEMAGNHRGYKLPGAETRSIMGPFDYTIEGPDGSFDNMIGVERKSLVNLLGEVTSGGDRWKRALQRMAETESPCIVLETSLSEILVGGFRHTRVNPNAVVGAVFAWSRRHRVPIWLTENRSGGKMLTQWWLARAAWDIHRKGSDS